MTVLRNSLTSELHEAVRSVRRVRFDRTHFVRACERQTEGGALR